MRHGIDTLRPMRRFSPLIVLLAAACIPGNEPDPPGGYDAPAAPPLPAARPDQAPPPSIAYPAEDRASVPPQVAAARPAWSAAPVEADARDVAASSYRVQPGDTLRRISDRTGAASEAIARENGLAPPFLIRAGQRLRIPPGRYHLVRAGQSGIAIARAYGVEWARIVALNDLEEPYILRTGQRLLLPSTGEVRDMSLEQRAAAFMLDIDDLITGGEPALASNARPAPPVQTARRPVPSARPVAPPTRFTGRFDWPLDGAIINRFGPYGSGRINDGINIRAAVGTPIRASADGVVAYAGSEIAVFGGLILIKHGDNWITTYGHASELLVTRGQAVKRGQIIARAGETGTVREPQLHFEIRQGRKPVDPMIHLPRRS
ncbi:M23 family metallopeptidase [Sphingomonas sp. 1P06PA]|uniref:peptidoglycan DD-metalloendopeptidase family protein n=1 Tax=Sphingomonas sp. 1P06PA TaxID=554121 RepID=UPI0039A4B0CE